jgi:hypothetical protein
MGSPCIPLPKIVRLRVLVALESWFEAGSSSLKRARTCLHLPNLRNTLMCSDEASSANPDNFRKVSSRLIRDQLFTGNRH